MMEPDGEELSFIRERGTFILSLQRFFGVAEHVPPPHLPNELRKSHACSRSAPQKIPASPEGGTSWNRHTCLHVKLNAPVKKKCEGREAEQVVLYVVYVYLCIHFSVAELHGTSEFC